MRLLRDQLFDEAVMLSQFLHKLLPICVRFAHTLFQHAYDRVGVLAVFLQVCEPLVILTDDLLKLAGRVAGEITHALLELLKTFLVASVYEERLIVDLGDGRWSLRTSSSSRLWSNCHLLDHYLFLLPR